MAKYRPAPKPIAEANAMKIHLFFRKWYKLMPIWIISMIEILPSSSTD
ncbi:hypothetical protein [Aquirufa ecclesiirivi]|nr:hypothetical protein [Aquirufa ecclesiirivi]MCZ2471480.1 hypothetical protein [Aquirufa ecclesiirivi]